MLIVPDIHIRKLEMVGSQVICNPPPDLENSDIDILVLVWSMKRAEKQLRSQVWIIEGNRGAYGRITYSDFFSARMHDHNLIVTSRGWFFDRFIKATRLAKNLNLLKKEDRITLFEYVLYDLIHTDDEI